MGSGWLPVTFLLFEDFVVEVFGTHVGRAARVFVTFEVVNEKTFTEARVVHEHLAFRPLDENIKLFHCCRVLDVSFIETVICCGLKA